MCTPGYQVDYVDMRLGHRYGTVLWIYTDATVISARLQIRLLDATVSMIPEHACLKRYLFVSTPFCPAAVLYTLL